MKMYEKARQLYGDDQIKMNAFYNACDCLHYGYGKKQWGDCGIDEADRPTIWKQAFYFVAEEEE